MYICYIYRYIYRDTANSAQDGRAQTGDTAGSGQGITALGDRIISLTGDMAGSAQDLVSLH